MERRKKLKCGNDHLMNRKSEKRETKSVFSEYASVILPPIRLIYSWSECLWR